MASQESSLTSIPTDSSMESEPVAAAPPPSASAAPTQIPAPTTSTPTITLADAMARVNSLEALIGERDQRIEWMNQNFLSELKKENTKVKEALLDKYQTKITQPQTTSRGIKVAHPDSYDGTRAKLPVFLRQLELYFRANPTDYTSDNNRITLTLSYMKDGTAGTWADHLIKESEGLGDYGYTWLTFVATLKEQFADPDQGDTARTKLKELKQGKQTADEFVVAFEQYERESGYDEVALIERFEEGLSQGLVDRIYGLSVMPTTIVEWKQWAQKLDRQWRKRESKKKTSQVPFGTRTPNRSTSFGTPAPAPVTTPKPSERQYIPMDIDRSRGGYVGERKPLICFKCRRPGHRAVDCKEKINFMEMTFEEIRKVIIEDEKKEGF